MNFYILLSTVLFPSFSLPTATRSPSLPPCSPARPRPDARAGTAPLRRTSCLHSLSIKTMGVTRQGRTQIRANYKLLLPCRNRIRKIRMLVTFVPRFVPVFVRQIFAFFMHPWEQQLHRKMVRNDRNWITKFVCQIK